MEKVTSKDGTEIAFEARCRFLVAETGQQLLSQCSRSHESILAGHHDGSDPGSHFPEAGQISEGCPGVCWH